MARWLRRHPAPAAISPLKAALARENVRWVRVALVEAIEEAERTVETSLGHRMPGDTAEMTDDLAQAYSDGRRDGLLQALHEITGPLGFARAAAESGLGEGHPVRAHLERVRGVVSALRQLAHASDVSERREFDLAQLVSNLCDAPPTLCPEYVVGSRGDSPFVVNGDPDLLELALRPLLSNAIEAVLSVTPMPPPRSVMISYGIEGSAYFVAIIDRGLGLAADPAMLTTGVSTKNDHIGLGLTIARTAIESLGGSLGLGDNGQGGATAILRWPRAL
jgi:signal transduction histidine kinase